MGSAHRPAINILMTCANDAGVGGVQLVFRDLINWLERNNRHVHLLYQAPLPRLRMVERTNSWGRRAFYCPLPTIVGGSAFLGLPVFLAYLPIALLHLVRLIATKKIDVINCHYLNPYFLHLVIAARLLRVPVVVSVHGADIDRYADVGRGQRLLLRLVMRGAHCIVACSKALAAQTIHVFPAVHRKVTYVHNGLDPEHFEGASLASAVPGTYVLSVCRQVPKKGVDTLLRAFALVQRDFPALSLVVVGDGPSLQDNKALARALGIDRQVRFAGDLPHAEVPPYFAGCALYVQPSRAEPFGLVLLEAAFYRKAIVSTRVGGVPEILTHDVDGRLVAPDDPDAMAAQMVALLRDPGLAARLGARAHDTLMASFLWKDRVRDYIRIYDGAPSPSSLDLDPRISLDRA